MASTKVFSKDGQEQGSTELDGAVFDMVPNEVLVHQVCVALRNAQRQGNAETKTRREVRGGGAKPFRQKGTGRARQGSSREPQMRGGGSVFGPHKRSYAQKISTGVRRQALCCALSDSVRNDRLCVVDALPCDAPKTKPIAELVGKLSPQGAKTLIVTADSDKNVMMSVRNLPRVSIRMASDLNALDVLNATRVVVLQDALGKLSERLT